MHQRIDDIQLFLECNDDSLFEEIFIELQSIDICISKIESEAMLSNEEDKSNATVLICAGQGGIEAQDWTQMLMRSIVRWAEKNDFYVEYIHWIDGKTAGIKSVTLQIYGENAYGYLKALHGVQRIQRNSPFSSNNSRETSFASIAVTPLIEKENIEIIINESLLERDTYCSSGPGGQNVNKVETAVRLTYPYIDSNGVTHIIIVACQEERSQLSNGDRAMKMLKAKIELINKNIEREKLEAQKISRKKNTFGSQIISYVFQPYTMVKDHRTGYITSDIDSIMNGNLNEIIKQYLISKYKKQIQ